MSKEFTEGTAARPAGTHTLDAWSWIARARAAAARAVEPPTPESPLESSPEKSAGTPGGGPEATAAAGGAQPG